MKMKTTIATVIKGANIINRLKGALLGCMLLPTLALAEGTVISEKGTGKSVCLKDGKLVYAKDEKGNQLPDFSNVGYHSGEKAIPDVPVQLTLSPVEGDNTVAIQKAIDTLGSRESDKTGFRGAILLKRGTYRVNGSLKIIHSGIVLRGEGCGPDGTIVIAAGYTKRKHRRTLITIGNSSKIRLIEESKQTITDPYVPIGAHSFSLASTTGYKVGDRIALHRPATDKWLQSIGMDKLTNPWKANEYHFNFERKITAINGNTITLDAPNMHPLDKEYGGGSIYKYESPGRVFEVGIENLRLVSEFAEPIPGHPYGDPTLTNRVENHGWKAIEISRNTENTWVRNVVGNYFGWSLVSLRGKRGTVSDCVNLGHASRIDGGRRYPFMIDGQMNIVQRCVTFKGRHEFVNQARTAGPNVFVDCIGFNSRQNAGPHHRYAIGNLYDNVKVKRGFEAINAKNRGTGHGWTGVQVVFYNCVAERFNVRNPPGAMSWVIGSGRNDGKGKAMRSTPASLYYQQLEERLGNVAVERLTTSEQRSTLGKYLWVDSLVKNAKGDAK